MDKIRFIGESNFRTHVFFCNNAYPLPSLPAEFCRTSHFPDHVNHHHQPGARQQVPAELRLHRQNQETQ